MGVLIIKKNGQAEEGALALLAAKKQYNPARRPQGKSASRHEHSCSNGPGPGINSFEFKFEGWEGPLCAVAPPGPGARSSGPRALGAGPGSFGPRARAPDPGPGVWSEDWGREGVAGGETMILTAQQL